MTISNWMASLALVNGTAGGIVLVLPIIGLDAGWVMIPILIFVASLSCYYTAVVMFRHLGEAQTINQCILNHFKNHRFCEFYNLTMFLSFFAEMLLYFDLLVSQTQGILYFVHQNIKTHLPFYISIFLVVLALLTRFFNFQDKLLGYGIISMIAFCIFVGWIIIDRDGGQNNMPAVKGTFVNLGAAMSQGYSIHNMMIPVVLRIRNPKDYKKILANVFVIAAILYTFIAYGSFAILNREPISGTGQTVDDYFSGDQWEIYLLRGIYILNIVTVFPQFLSISRIRFFNLFHDQDSRLTSITPKQVIYYIVIIGICLLTKIFNYKAATIIQLNGSIICFMEIYLIPLVIHLKCLWWDFDDSKQPRQTQFCIEHLQADNSYLQHLSKQSQKDQQQLKQTSRQNEQIQQRISEVQPQRICPCQSQSIQSKSRYKQTAISIVVLCYGLFVMVYTLFTAFFKTGQ